MRLLHLTQSYYPFLDMGGPTVKVRALARGLASSGHAVTVVTADLGFDRDKREVAGAVPGRWGLEAAEDGVQSIYLRTRARYRNLTWNPGLAAFCREQLSARMTQVGKTLEELAAWRPEAATRGRRPRAS